MSEPGTDDVGGLDVGDLPGRLQLVAIGSFFALIAVVFGAPWLLGHYWLWDHARLVGPVLGGAYFFGTCGWWVRRAGLLADRSVTPNGSAATEIVAPTDAQSELQLLDEAAEALHRLHIRAWWPAVRRPPSVAPTARTAW